MAHMNGAQVPPASSTRRAPQGPPRPPRKPDSFRNEQAEKEREQARQIQASREEITFT